MKPLGASRRIPRRSRAARVGVVSDAIGVRSPDVASLLREGGHVVAKPYLPNVVSVDDEQFQSLLAQVRDLHRLADEVTRESSRLRANVQARLSWERDPPSLPRAQREIADEVVEILSKPRLSTSQSRQLRHAFFGR